jgi:CDP-diacylglycerol--glycerol-3-phosphate 3-phosphatidyltransferase
MNLPNALTLLRVAIVPFFGIVLAHRDARASSIAALLFLLAAATDNLDGYIARSRNQVTTFGEIMDPIADKALVATAAIMLSVQHRLAVWITVVILAREFLVTGLRFVALRRNVVIAASPWGKWKTASQILGLLLVLLPLEPAAFWLRDTAMYVAVALTLWSGIDYMLAYRRPARAE